MTQQKFRSTDAPMARPMPYVMLTAEDARNAPLPTVHCGWCSWSGNDADLPAHRCVDAAGRDLTPLKRAAAEGARRELAALSRFSIPNCEKCGKTDMRPGQSHLCVIGTKPMPHDIAAAQFQRAGVAQLAADLEDLKGDPR